MSFTERAIEKLIEFQKDSPEGFLELRNFVASMKGTKFCGEQYLSMLDALIRRQSVVEAWRDVVSQGIDCTKSSFDKVIMDVNRFISKYEYEHPYDIEVFLSEAMQKKVRDTINEILSEYGLELNDGRHRTYLCKKKDGSRFQNNHAIQLEDN